VYNKSPFIVVAAYNSKKNTRVRHKSVVDYVCRGINDDVEIQKAIDALPAGGGKVVLLEGTFNLSAQVSRAIDDVIIEGQGVATQLNLNGVTPVISVGAQSGWILRKFSTDAGDVDITNAVSPAVQDVWVNGTKIYGIIRTATKVVAAHDSSVQSKAQADRVCTGVDDQVDIQWAIDALPAGGGKVKLLEGTFNVSASLTPVNSLTLEGMGSEATKILFTANADFMYVLPRENLVIRDICFDGESVKASNCCFNRMSPGELNIISGCKFKNWHEVLLAFGRGTISECVFQDNDFTVSAPFYATIKGCRWEGNHDVYHQRGLSVNGGVGSVSIIGNYFKGNRYSSCYVGSARSEVSIIGNTFVDVDLTGIEFKNGAHNCVAIGNVLLETRINPVPPEISAGHFALDFHNCYDCIATGNIISGDWLKALWLKEDDVAVNDVKNNYIAGNIGINQVWTIDPISLTSKNRLYEARFDAFEDVLAVSPNYIVNVQNLVNGAVALTGTQPKYPRGLDCTITNVGGAVSAYTMTVVGVNGKGDTVTEIFTFAVDGLAFSSGNAFDHVTSVTLADVVDTGNATFVMGIDGRLGLKNVISETADVWKITKNLAKQVVAVAQVDVAYDTYDMAAAIGIALNDDFVIYYRSNLNIIS